jgi:toxin ParE1/3/4
MRWLLRAQKDLSALREYVAEEDPHTAENLGGRIIEGTDVLIDFPSAGGSGRVHNTRELLIVGTPYIVVYRVRTGTVEILKVLHGARMWPTK